MLARADGTLTSNIDEMDDLVRLTWGPIMQKYGEVAEPDEDKFMEKYSKHVRKVQMEVTASMSCKKMSMRTASSKQQAVSPP